MLTIILAMPSSSSALADRPDLAATKPNSFRIARTAIIQAPAEAIFPLINDFHRGAWSSYEKGTRRQRTYSSTTSRQGRRLRMERQPDIGAGRIEITEAAPPSQDRHEARHRSPV